MAVEKKLFEEIHFLVDWFKLDIDNLDFEVVFERSSPSKKAYFEYMNRIDDQCILLFITNYYCFDSRVPNERICFEVDIKNRNAIPKLYENRLTYLDSDTYNLDGIAKCFLTRYADAGSNNFSLKKIS